jgi:hypothetical protein
MKYVMEIVMGQKWEERIMFKIRKYDKIFNGIIVGHLDVEYGCM